MRKFDLTATKGDLIPLRCAVVRNGSALNITGATFQLTARQWLSDTVPLITSDDFDIESPSGGIVIVNIAPELTEDFEDTVNLNVVIKMIELDGTPTTIARGKLKVEDN